MTTYNTYNRNSKSDFVTECVMQVVKSNRYITERDLCDMLTEEIYRELYIRRQTGMALNEGCDPVKILKAAKAAIPKFKEVFTTVSDWIKGAKNFEKLKLLFMNGDFRNSLPSLIKLGFGKTKWSKIPAKDIRVLGKVKTITVGDNADLIVDLFVTEIDGIKYAYAPDAKEQAEAATKFIGSIQDLGISLAEMIPGLIGWGVKILITTIFGIIQHWNDNVDFWLKAWRVFKYVFLELTGVDIDQIFEFFKEVWNDIKSIPAKIEKGWNDFTGQSWEAYTLVNSEIAANRVFFYYNKYGEDGWYNNSIPFAGKGDIADIDIVYQRHRAIERVARAYDNLYELLQQGSEYTMDVAVNSLMNNYYGKKYFKDKQVAIDFINKLMYSPDSGYLADFPKHYPRSKAYRINNQVVLIEKKVDRAILDGLASVIGYSSTDNGWSIVEDICKEFRIDQTDCAYLYYEDLKKSLGDDVSSYDHNLINILYQNYIDGLNGKISSGEPSREEQLYYKYGYTVMNKAIPKLSILQQNGWLEEFCEKYWGVNNGKKQLEFFKTALSLHSNKNQLDYIKNNFLTHGQFSAYCSDIKGWCPFDRTAFGYEIQKQVTSLNPRLDDFLAIKNGRVYSGGNMTAMGNTPQQQGSYNLNL